METCPVHFLEGASYVHLCKHICMRACMYMCTCKAYRQIRTCAYTFKTDAFASTPVQAALSTTKYMHAPMRVHLRVHSMFKTYACVSTSVCACACGKQRQRRTCAYMFKTYACVNIPVQAHMHAPMHVQCLWKAQAKANMYMYV